MTVGRALKFFHIRILIHVYNNLGIAVIFRNCFFQKFPKINKRRAFFNYLRYALTYPCLETGLGHDLHEKNALYCAQFAN